MSVRVLLRKTHQKLDGTYPVVIQVIANRKVKIVSTGFSVKENQFRDGIENWIHRHPDAFIMNDVINTKRSALLENSLGADINGNLTFFKVINAMLHRYESRNNVAAYYRLKTNFDMLKEVWGQDVLLSKLNADLVNKYINHRYAVKKNVASTVKKNLKDLSVVLRSVEDYQGRDWFDLASKKIKPEPVDRQSLRREDLVLLETVNLTGLVDLSRDMFLFAYYCHGMRFESVALLERANIKHGFIRYRMNKGKKIREIEIHTKLKKIIDKYSGDSLYLFPVIKVVPDAWNKKHIVGSANTMMRTYLNRAAILAGLDRHIIFHQARHTFANLSRERGLSYSTLQDALGHSNFATTKKYLTSLSDAVIHDEIREKKIFD